MNILLIDPPWGASLRPSLGLHVLKAYLEHEDPARQVVVQYANLDFYDSLPKSFDKSILHSVFWSNPEISWSAEAFFAPFSYQSEATRNHLLEDFRRRLVGISERNSTERLIPPQLHDWLEKNCSDALSVMSNVIPAFLNAFCESDELANADILGFGHHFNQLFGTLAMARAAKTMRPGLPIALGGASMTMPLAEVVKNTFPQIDHLFVGDSEVSFSELCDRLTEGTVTQRGHIAKFTASHSVTPDAEVDYSRFFTRIAGTRFGSQLRSTPIELTRDCYWARLSQCSFCGLPQNRNNRASNTQQVLAKVIELYEQQSVRHFIFADPAIHHSKHAPLIAGLADYFAGKTDQPVFFFEARADIPRETLETLARLENVVVQVGIESFGHGALKLMKKGTSPLENIQLLKWCKELGIFPYYNLLWGHPGEEPMEYDAMATLLPRLMHLTPPSGYTPVLLCRDGPLFEQGCDEILTVTPWPEYAYLFPTLPQEELAKAAYYFDYDAIDINGNPITTRPALDRMVESWQENGRFGNVHLVHYMEKGSLVISDNRGITTGIVEERVFRLSNASDIAILEILDTIHTTDDLKAKMVERGDEITEPALMDRLMEFTKAGLVMSEGDRHLFLSLAI